MENSAVPLHPLRASRVCIFLKITLIIWVLLWCTTIDWFALYNSTITYYKRKERKWLHDDSTQELNGQMLQKWPVHFTNQTCRCSSETYMTVCKYEDSTQELNAQMAGDCQNANWCWRDCITYPMWYVSIQHRWSRIRILWFLLLHIWPQKKIILF
jgi:hypothetical protein